MHYLPDSNIVVGLDWRLYETLNAARSALRGQKNVVFARKAIGQECAQGVCEATNIKRGAVSGALLLAEAAGSALAYRELEDGLAWVCAIKEGVPIQGFDVVVSTDEARGLITEAMSYVPGADLYGDIQGARGPLENLFSAVPQKRVKACQLEKQASPWVPIVVLIVGFSIIGGAGYGVYQIEQHQRLKEEGLRLSLLQAQQEEEIRKAREQRIKEIKAEIDRRKATLWNANSVTKQMDQWLGAYWQIINPVDGWKATSMECSVAACEAKWGKSSPRVLASAIHSIPGKINFATATEHQATATMTIDSVEPTSWTSGLSRWDFFDKSALLSVQGCSVVFMAPSERIDVKNIDDTMLLLAHSGQWSVSCPNFVLLREMLRKIELPGMEATSIKFGAINAGKPGTLEINGKYRVTE